MIRGIVSGYFNPLHRGHIEYIHAAKSACEYLIVIINNDRQVRLKGAIPFMDVNHRSFIIQALKDVNSVIVSIDDDKTVCNSLRAVRKVYPADDLIFFNSGDRTQENLEPKEGSICRELGIKEVVLSLPKRYSSSELIRKAALEI